jgi:hypothetical protein
MRTMKSTKHLHLDELRNMEGSHVVLRERGGGGGNKKPRGGGGENFVWEIFPRQYTRSSLEGSCTHPNSGTPLDQTIPFS